MPAYAIALLNNIRMGPAIHEYLKRIDDTLTPYQGAFRVHGAPKKTLEPGFIGDIVIIEFPDTVRAQQWYESPAYQAILPMRTEHANCVAFIVPGVQTGYRADELLRKLTA